MTNLFISFNYFARFGSQYDQGYYNMILEDTAMPTTQEELEYFTGDVTDLFRKLQKFDSVTLTILNFKEL